MIDEVLYKSVIHAGERLKLLINSSPALHALKRHQLMSLSKRYGLKASGKVCLGIILHDKS